MYLQLHGGRGLRAQGQLFACQGQAILSATVPSPAVQLDWLCLLRRQGARGLEKVSQYLKNALLYSYQDLFLYVLCYPVFLPLSLSPNGTDWYSFIFLSTLLLSTLGKHLPLEILFLSLTERMVDW